MLIHYHICKKKLIVITITLSLYSSSLILSAIPVIVQFMGQMDLFKIIVNKIDTLVLKT